jgi:hypothetical protein
MKIFFVIFLKMQFARSYQFYWSDQFRRKHCPIKKKKKKALNTIKILANKI